MGKEWRNFFGAVAGHMVLRGNEGGGAKEKFNSHMPYLLLGAEHVCLREGQKHPIG